MNLSSTPIAIEIGHAIKQARLAQSLSLEELSRLSGVGIATLSHLENGNRDPRLSTIERIVRALRCDLPTLLHHTNSSPSAVPVPPEGGYDLDAHE